ncbi:MAG: Gfo/Idh/MocA family oxidoreductase [Lachnospiraceae bacterium]|nr:Gfo/Idh/MocA family oxidoreductase [Lachnospiraceae bacterium]
MKIGILGAGHIAGTLAETMGQMPEVECYAVAAREIGRAENFCKKYGFTKAYGSYEEMLNDEQVELVYVATPHSHHYEHMKLCIMHGKPVLCEKAFTMNSAQAKEIARLAQEKGVYVTEAIWTRYMPSRQIINDAIASGLLGQVSMLTANLSYDIDTKERIIRPELAGGALLDVGVYALNFALMHFGNEIAKVESSVMKTQTGVDGMETITLSYQDGRMASLTAGIYGRSDRKGIVYGEKGYLVVENINNPQSVRIYDTDDKLMKEYEIPEQISGYEYEIRECIEQIKKGATESLSMPLQTSIEVMEMMDGLRKQWGIQYPGETA